MDRGALERKFVRDLLDLLDYQQAEVNVVDLDEALDRGDIYAVYALLGIGAGSDIRPKLAALFAVHLRASFEEAIQDYLEPFAAAFNVADPALAELIAEQANESAVLMLTHARSTVDGTLRRHAGADAGVLSALLIGGLWLTDREAASVQAQQARMTESGVSAGVIRRNIRRLSRRLTRTRVVTTASTLITKMIAGGFAVAVAILLALGLITPTTLKMWVTADDELVCPICGPMHGVTVPVKDNFPISLPPHPRCRCYLEFASPTERSSWPISWPSSRRSSTTSRATTSRAPSLSPSTLTKTAPERSWSARKPPFPSPENSPKMRRRWVDNPPATAYYVCVGFGREADATATA